MNSHPMVLRPQDLAILEPQLYAGRGSSKALHRVTDPMGRVGLWKEYKDEVSDTLDPDTLLRLVEWPSTLPPSRREAVEARMAFPWAVVRGGSRTIGVVMPEAGPQFFYYDRRQRSRPRTIDALSISRARAVAEEKQYFESPHKLALLGRVLALLADLQELDVVIGDLQPQNILVSADRLQPAIMLLDCDSLWLHGEQAFSEALDPDLWRSPFMHGGFTAQTDLFKLALLVTRCLQEDNRIWGPDEHLLAAMMPVHQRALLTGLLEGDSRFNAAQLRVIARNWTARVTSEGKFLVTNDACAIGPWEPPAEPDSSVTGESQASTGAIGRTASPGTAGSRSDDRGPGAPGSGSRTAPSPRREGAAGATAPLPVQRHATGGSDGTGSAPSPRPDASRVAWWVVSLASAVAVTWLIAALANR